MFELVSLNDVLVAETLTELIEALNGLSRVGKGAKIYMNNLKIVAPSIVGVLSYPEGHFPNHQFRYLFNSDKTLVCTSDKQRIKCDVGPVVCLNEFIKILTNIKQSCHDKPVYLKHQDDPEAFHLTVEKPDGPPHDLLSDVNDVCLFIKSSV